MIEYQKHLIQKSQGVRDALTKLNSLALAAILFVVDDKNVLIGSLTDGDIRRGFIKGLDFDNKLTDFIEENPVYISQKQYSVADVASYRNRNINIIPIVDSNKVIVDILNLRIDKSILPVDAVIMAGGEGRRLLPLTLHTPKPLLKVGDKPIIEHNIDRLSQYGIKHIHISINYLGDQLMNYFGDGSPKNLSIQYIKEDKPLGTIGALGLVEGFENDIILIMNSDLLTNIDFEEFYLEFIKSNSDMAVATVPYLVNIPYAVLETEEDFVRSFKEKPTYTYYSNAGIYLIKKSILDHIPANEHFNATDLMELLISSNYKILSYPLISYWLDIGKHEDYQKAQEDIKHIRF